MSMNPLNPNLPIRPADFPTTQAPLGKAEPGRGFGDALHDAVAEVDTLNLDASYQVSSLLEGNGTDVHEAMIAVQKAELSFQLMLQVRNKVVQAYQQIAGMQF